jgi:ankyrin repeat protein
MRSANAPVQESDVLAFDARIDVLHKMIDDRNVEATKGLILQGVNPDAKSSKGAQTPLMQAARAGSLEISEFLIESGADPNLGSPTGLTALMVAARQSEFLIARLLIDHGADVNAKHMTGCNALSFSLSTFLPTDELKPFNRSDMASCSSIQGAIRMSETPLV